MKKIVLTMVVYLFSMSAQAVLVDFQDVSSSNCQFYDNQITSQGYTLTDDGSPVSYEGLWMCNAGVIANNPTQALVSANGPSYFRLTEENGNLFSLDSFESGARNGTSATGIDLLGLDNLGNSLMASFSFTGSNWETFSLASAWNNLVNVQFSVVGSGNAQFLLDNISVNASVPAPAPLALFGLGLLGLAARRKRRL